MSSPSTGFIRVRHVRAIIDRIGEAVSIDVGIADGVGRARTGRGSETRAAAEQAMHGVSGLPSSSQLPSEQTAPACASHHQRPGCRRRRIRPRRPRRRRIAASCSPYGRYRVTHHCWLHPHHIARRPPAGTCHRTSLNTPSQRHHRGGGCRHRRLRRSGPPRHCNARRHWRSHRSVSADYRHHTSPGSSCPSPHRIGGREQGLSEPTRCDEVISCRWARRDMPCARAGSSTGDQTLERRAASRRPVT